MRLPAVKIQKYTRTDRVLSKVLSNMHGWAGYITDSELAAYFFRRHKLPVDQLCVTLGARIIIPHSLRKQVLHPLHEGHSGRTHMKMLARSYVWWLQLTQDM